MSNTFFRKIKRDTRRILALFVISNIIWFLLNPNISYTNIIMAIMASYISVLIIDYIINYNTTDKMFSIVFLGFLFKIDFYQYLIFICKEVFFCTIDVLCLAFKTDYTSKIIEIQLPQHLSSYRVLLISYSITVTPGTTIININDNHIITIHCITSKSADSINEMTFINKLISFNF